MGIGQNPVRARYPVVSGQGFLTHEANTNESFGLMLLQLGEMDEARRRLSRSRDLYRQIGALAKASQMARVYAQWLDPTPSTAVNAMRHLCL